ncbi:MAG: hypothetical protein NZ828_05300 [Alphaproteobacteria bacterium]|nr:hypothetical protein [Alphaproteobacteria bacterium]
MSQTNINTLRNKLSDDGLVAQRAVDFAKALGALIKGTTDPYIKNVYASATEKKLFKKAPESAYDAFADIFKATQILRLATVLRSLPDMAFTYEAVDPLIVERSLLDNYGYNFSDKNHNRYTLKGPLSTAHKAQLVGDVIAGTKPNELAGNLKSSLKDYLPYVVPKSCTLESSWTPSAYLRQREESYVAPIEARLIDIGFDKAELELSGQNFDGGIQVLSSLCALDNYVLNNDANAYLQNVIVALPRDLDRVRGYLTTYANDLELALMSEVNSALGEYWRILDDLVPQIIVCAEEKHSVEEDLAQVNAYRARLDKGEAFNVLSDSGAYSHIKLSDDVRDLTDAYLGAKIEMLNGRRTGDLGGDARLEAEQNIARFEAQLKPKFDELDVLDQQVAFLHSGRVPVNGENARNIVLKTHGVIQKMVDLLPQIADEVDHKIYCTLKASGQYGEANLMAAFIAAAQAKPQDGEEAPNIASSLGLVNTVLRTDLMMHGWDGALPAALDTKNMPNLKDLVWLQNNKYSMSQSLYEQDGGISPADAQDIIAQDLPHRINYLQKLGRVLHMAGDHVAPQTKAKIALSLEQLVDTILPKFKEICTAQDMSFDQMFKAPECSDAVQPKAALK